MSDYIWSPTPERIEEANVTRLGRKYGLEWIEELRARSVEDPWWYWDSAIRDLGIPFTEPYNEVVDLTNGVESPDWFVGGTFNVVDACLTRWQADRGDRDAIIHENEEGVVTRLTYSELADQVARAASGLEELGVRSGDAVALYLPMIPEAVVAFYAAASIGAIVVPLFSGFAAPAIVARLNDAQAKALIVADGTVRRGRSVDMIDTVEQALHTVPSVRSVVLVPNLGSSAEPTSSHVSTTTWSALLAGGSRQPTAFATDQTLMLGYTSGTTGKPKGAVHTHAGFTVKVATEAAYSFDVKPGDRFCWVTDMGWVMGPLAVIAAHSSGAALVLYEGAPNAPDNSRLWRVVENHQITMLGLSPTLIRALKSTPTAEIEHYDLASVNTLGSTGEPWDPNSYDWLAETVFKGRVPVINFSGGTEVGGSFLAPYPVEAIASCSLGGPSLGMAVDVVDGDGRSIRGAIGELVCRFPWPSMTRSVWGDHERYLEAYWSTFDGIWCHGDYAMVDPETGSWYLLGRSDDVMNIAGKRIAPSEVESVVSVHPAVAESAAVSVPDDDHAEKIWLFWVPQGTCDTTATAEELRQLVATGVGKPFAPREVIAVEALPKTRSAKILRRAIRAVAIGGDPGDMSSAENPESLDGVRSALATQRTSA